MVSLWSALLRSGLPSDILEGEPITCHRGMELLTTRICTLDVNFAIYGLGDSSYEKFCYAGKILARRMISLGARLLTAPHEEQNGDSVEDAFAGKLQIVERRGDGDDEFEARACLAWGDERAPDG